MKDNIFIMYTNFNHACKFINYELLPTRGTEPPMLVGTSANLNHVITTNVVHYEKLINKNNSFYKYLLPTTRGEKIQSLQISLLLGVSGGGQKIRKICREKSANLTDLYPPTTIRKNHTIREV
jgi:hypothetical protein